MRRGLCVLICVVPGMSFGWFRCVRSSLWSREASAAGDEGDFDPFKRRSCRPKILWSVGQNSPPRPPAGGGAAGGDGTGEEKTAATAAGDSGAANGAGGEGARAAEAAPAVQTGGQPKGEEGGLQSMHSFGGVDIMEAGRLALEKRMNAVKTKAASRQGGKLTLDKYLEKARVDA